MLLYFVYLSMHGKDDLYYGTAKGAKGNTIIGKAKDEGMYNEVQWRKMRLLNGQIFYTALS